MPAWAMYAFLSRGSYLFHVPVSIPSVFLTVLSCCCRSFQMSFLPGSLTRRSPVCPPDDELLVGRHGGADGSHLDGHGGSSWDLLLLYCSGKIRPRLCIQKNQTTSEQQDAEKLATEMGAAFGRDERPADRARRSGSGRRSKASLGERGGLQEPLSCGHTDTVLCVSSHGPTKITHIQSLMRCI